MKRKYIIYLLVALMTLSTILFVACNKQEVKLVDFPTTKTEEARNLGDVYDLRRTVTDTNGKEYMLTAEVKTSAGGSVSVVSNRFELTDLGGYVITYTVEISESDTRTSVVTVPCVDGTPPAINIEKPVLGFVNELYTLPKITYTDISELKEVRVVVYLVGEDGELTEQSITKNEGKYTFTPQVRGTYRISVTAKDVNDNENTRTADFVVDKISEGEIFNPEFLGARDQLRTSKDPSVEYTYVSAEENDDETYGGAYWRLAPSDIGKWFDIFLTPCADVSSYADYDVITFWLYVENSDNVTFNVAVLNDGDSAIRDVSNGKWILCEIDVEKFISNIGSQYFIAIDEGNYTGVRIGEVMARTRISYEISEIEVTDVTAQANATVSFSVTATLDSPYMITVTDNEGTVVQTIPYESDGNYSFEISDPGNYTLTVVPEEGIYYGSLQKQFVVKRDIRIQVNGTYPEIVESGVPLTIYEASVYSGGSPTEGLVSVSIYKFVGQKWEKQEVSGSTYTPEESGRIKLEYTSDGVDPVSYEIDVAGRGVIFDPAAEGALNQMKFSRNVQNEFVSAEENADSVYGGAYYRFSSLAGSTQWCNINLQPRLNWQAYEKYDTVVFWIYLEKADGFAYNFINLSMFNDASFSEKMPVEFGKWTLCQFDMDKFISNNNAAYFVGLNPKSTAAARIGTVIALNSATVSVSDIEVGFTGAGPAEVSFTVTTDPADLQYTVAVTAPDGSPVVATIEGSSVRFTSNVAGEYCYKVLVSEGYYAETSGTITVLEDKEIKLPDGMSYPSAVEAGKEFLLLDAELYLGGVKQEEGPARTVFVKATGEDWVDVTSQIVGNSYTPQAGDFVRIVYSYSDISKTFELVAAPAGEVFNPGAADVTDDFVTTSGKAFDYKDIPVTFVTAEENNDETYGDSYVYVSAPETGWGNVKVKTRFDLSYYAQYDVISFWVYIESSVANKNLLIMNETDLTQTGLQTNQWHLISFDAQTFVEKYQSKDYFISVDFTDVTQLRLGMVFGGNNEA